jgi:SAM-dependent methyltransferase
MRSRSYSSQRTGPLDLFQEARHLYHGHTGSISGRVERALDRLREIEELSTDFYGLELKELDMLDVGAGQRLLQMAYFSENNRVVGIDADVIVQGVDILGIVKMLRANGFRRAAKTLIRKSVGIDRLYRRELVRQAGLERFPRLSVLHMDARALAFDDESFDFSYSTTVFHHLPQPESVVREMVRVLRPGGVLFIDFMPFTGKTGALDIRMISGDSVAGSIPTWAHLRPQHVAATRDSAYLNRLRLREWTDLFEETAPGCRFVFRQPDAEANEQEARRLRAQGELLDFELDELITAEVFVLWQKPSLKITA